MTIIGDVRAEFRAKLPGIGLGGSDDDVLSFAKVDLVLAGTAVNMARAAAGMFATVTVIAKIGKDLFTPWIHAETGRINATWRFLEDPWRGNGVVLILRDCTPGRADGRRILVSSSGSPGHALSAAEVEAQEDAIAASDLLFADGYAMLSEVSAEGVLTAARIARRRGVRICFDLVPHRIDDHLNQQTIASFLAVPDIVIAEARTMARLVGFSSAYPFTTEAVPPLLERVVRRYPGVSTWILRFGVGDMQRSVMSHVGGDLVYYDTGYCEADSKTGFGDRVAAAELFQLISVAPPAGPGTQLR